MKPQLFSPPGFYTRLREGKQGLEEPTQSLLPWKIKQMNLAIFWFIPTPLNISDKTAESLIPSV